VVLSRRCSRVLPGALPWLTLTSLLTSSLTSLLTSLMVLTLLTSSAALAQRDATRDALERLGEVLEPVVNGGALEGVAPIIVVGAAPAFEATRSWFPTAAVVAFGDAVGRGKLRACEACMQPRVQAEGGAFVYASGTLSIAEIVAVDTDTRGAGAPAAAAAWIDETDDGIAVRVVSLRTGQILYAANIDGRLREQQRSAKNFSFTDDLERRLRGESLTHVWVDLGLYPGQHVSLDVVDQFGDRNLDLAGITFSAFDPIVGVGAVYYRVIPEAFNLTLGGQLVVSVPTAAGNALGLEGQVLDPLLTGVVVLRLPIPQTSYGVLLTASTNGQIGLGVSLLNINFLPVLP
jgi:hypothetical protein